MIPFSAAGLRRTLRPAWCRIRPTFPNRVQDLAHLVPDGPLSLLRRGAAHDSDGVLDAVADSDQRERLAAQHPELPEFLRDAIAAYATRRL